MTERTIRSSPRRSRVRRIAALTVLVALWIVLHPSMHQAQPNEYHVKAAYLFNFGKFVEWPPGTAATQDEFFAVCVLGQDPFGTTLDSTFANERIGGKRVIARRISKATEAVNCRILFIGSSERAHLKEILTAVEKTGVLTVSDIPQFSRLGGMIQFILEGSKIRFEINLAIAENAGLSVSSELLKVASAVRRSH